LHFDLVNVQRHSPPKKKRGVPNQHAESIDDNAAMPTRPPRARLPDPVAGGLQREKDLHTLVEARVRVEPGIVLVAAITNLNTAHRIDDNNSPPGLLYPPWLAERSRDFFNSEVNIRKVSVHLLIALQ
jgi:hypothetical protein